jgi:hypothetical protein
MIMMRPTLLFLAAALLSWCATVDAFTFMKGWKLPGRDRGARIAKQTFGDKSEYCCTYRQANNLCGAIFCIVLLDPFAFSDSPILSLHHLRFRSLLYYDTELAIITGASTPLGQQTIQDLLKTGEYHVIGAYANQNDVEKAKTKKDSAASAESSLLTPMVCDFASLDSVRDFCNQVHVFRGSKTVDKLLCQAGLQLLEGSSTPPVRTSSSSSNKSSRAFLTFTPDFLATYLLTTKLLSEGMVDSTQAPQVAMLGSKDCEDSLLCQQLVTYYLHTKYNKLTGVSFNTLALPSSSSSSSSKTTSVAKLLTSPKLAKQSGVNYVYNSMDDKIQLDVDNNNSKINKSYDIDAAYELVQACNALVDSQLPAIKQVTSPCPTLMVIGAITKQSVKREELKRMKQGRPGISEPIPVATLQSKLTKRQRVFSVIDKVVSTVLKQTIGRVARLAGRNVLGEIPQEALSGSYDEVIAENVNAADAKKLQVKVEEAAIDELQAEISNQLAREQKADMTNKSTFVFPLFGVFLLFY